jgi:hypothetical protein
MVKLIPLLKEHLSFVLEIRNHETTRLNLENNNIFNLKECENWFKNLKSPWYLILNDDIPVGYFRTNGDEIGCDIHMNYRKNGYAKMAYKIWLQNIELASLWVFEDNFAKKLYEDLGFKPNGEHKIIRGRDYIRMIYTN